MKEERGFAPLQKCNGCKTQQQISVAVDYLDKRDLDRVLDRDLLCDTCWMKAHNAIWQKAIAIQYVDDHVFCKCGREMIHLGDQDWFCAPCGWIEVKGSKA